MSKTPKVENYINTPTWKVEIKLGEVQEKIKGMLKLGCTCKDLKLKKLKHKKNILRRTLQEKYKWGLFDNLDYDQATQPEDVDNFEP